MLRTLFLVRHAHAADAELGQKDQERPLTGTGIRDASIVGKSLFEHYHTPDYLLSSTAHRAQETAQILAEQLQYAADKIVFEEEVYEASVRSLLAVVNRIPAAPAKVLLVAHNPGITYLSEYLTKESVPNMVPGSVMAMQFDGLSWAEVSEGTAHLIGYTSPAQLLNQQG